MAMTISYRVHASTRKTFIDTTITVHPFIDARRNAGRPVALISPWY
jgi:hypothetical protein